MSHLHLEHHHVRNLVAALSEMHRQPTFDEVREAIATVFRFSDVFYRICLANPGDGPVEGFVVTQAISDRIVGDFSRVIPGALRNKQRIKIVADAFGWRDDAFMHALKMAARREAAVSTFDVEDAAAWKRSGYSDMVNWQRAVSANGLCLVSGPTSSGKTTLLDITSRLPRVVERRVYAFSDHKLGKDGREGRDRDAAAFLDRIRTVKPGALVIFDEVSRPEEIEALSRLAASHLVLAAVPGNSIAGALSTITRWSGSGSADEDIHAIKGVAAVRLVRRLYNPDPEFTTEFGRGHVALCENVRFESDGQRAIATTLSRAGEVAERLNLDLDMLSVGHRFPAGWTPFRNQLETRIRNGDISVNDAKRFVRSEGADIGIALG